MAPLATSTSIYAAVITVVVMVGSVTKHVVQEKQIDVTFVEKILKEEPPAPAPPAPVPAPIARPEPPAAMAPVVRPDQKIRKLDKPPPRKELVAPKEVPQEAPKEARRHARRRGRWCDRGTGGSHAAYTARQQQGAALSARRAAAGTDRQRGCEAHDSR
jgi:hypothetical protein